MGLPGATELALCKAIIVMAHELGMQVVAEGVETGAQRDLLIGAGCDFGQGYLFARPDAASRPAARTALRAISPTRPDLKPPPNGAPAHPCHFADA